MAVWRVLMTEQAGFCNHEDTHSELVKTHYDYISWLQPVTKVTHILQVEKAANHCKSPLLTESCCKVTL